MASDVVVSHWIRTVPHHCTQSSIPTTAFLKHNQDTMKKYIKLFILLVVFIILLITFPPLKTKAEAPVEPMQWNKENLSHLIGYYANKYDVSEKVMHRIVAGESTYNIKPRDGDMKITCPRGVHKGNPVRARGLVQITECYFPEVTDEQAYDPEFSLEFLAYHLSKGKGRLWSTY